MGTPVLARTVLVELASTPGITLCGVVTQPDRRSGRHLELTPPPVKVEAVARGLPLWQPVKARETRFLDEMRALAPDLVVVAAYGQLLPQTLLDIPGHGCLNVHTSLLPRWRGAAPIQWAIAEGDPETGITLMRMEAGLDTGPILAQVRTMITDDDTGQSLQGRLAGLGARLLVESLPGYLAGNLVPQAQPAEGITHARKITREDGRLDFTQPAQLLWRRVRAFTPWPGAFCHIVEADARRLLKVHRALPLDEISASPGTVISAGPNGLVVACGQGALSLQEMQLEGGRRLSAEQFTAGCRPARLE